MGACVSTYPKKPANSGKKKRLIPSRFMKKESHNPVNFPVSDVKLKSKPSLTWREMSSFSGSKEETFFDAPMWINSSSDDDFCSVKGDFTPSLASSPSHGNSFIMRSSLDFGTRMSSRSNSMRSKREQMDDKDNDPKIRKNSRSSSFKDNEEELTDNRDAAPKDVTLAQLLQDGFWIDQAGSSDCNMSPVVKK